MVVVCAYCQKQFKKPYGLNQHMSASVLCLRLQEDFTKIEMGRESPAKKRPSHASPEKEGMHVDKIRHLLEQGKRRKLDRVLVHTGNEDDDSRYMMQNDSSDDDDVNEAQLELNEIEDKQNVASFDPLAEATEESTDEENVNLQANQAQVGIIDARKASTASRHFKKYVRNVYKNHLDFDKDEIDAIKLMHMLIRKKATLDTFEEVMEWHYRAAGMLKPHESYGKSKLFIGREKLMRKLKK